LQLLGFTDGIVDPEMNEKLLSVTLQEAAGAVLIVSRFQLQLVSNLAIVRVT
jgi:hypothetical protein